MVTPSKVTPSKHRGGFPEVFLKIGVLKINRQIAACNFIKKEAPTQVFSSF